MGSQCLDFQTQLLVDFWEFLQIYREALEEYAASTTPFMLLSSYRTPKPPELRRVLEGPGKGGGGHQECLDFQTQLLVDFWVFLQINREALERYASSTPFMLVLSYRTRQPPDLPRD